MATTPVNRTIAVIEDDARIGLLMKEIIDHATGLECIANYSSAEIALGALPRLAPDVLLVDINLPNTSGLACVRNLKPKMPATQFAILTVYDDVDVIFEALSAGAVGFLLKRSIGAELEKTLRNLLLGGSPMSSAVARKVVQSFQIPSVVALEGEQLSDRERRVLELLARGRSYKDTADEVVISRDILHACIRRIYEKLQVRSRVESASWPASVYKTTVD